MSFIRISSVRSGVASHLRTALGSHRPTPSQRRFASTGPSSQGSPRWLPVAIALSIPLSIYFWRRGDTNQPSENAVAEHHGANQEYIQSAEGNQDAGRTTQARDSGTKSSGHDEPRAMGPAGPPASMSFKQQGLSNADTMNPYINEPGKSEKGEGETETAKVKGTVKSDRPQV